MRFPFAHTPVFDAEAEVFLAAGLHQVAEEMAVAGIAPEDVVGIAGVRAVGLHLVVGLGLLLARLHEVYRACLYGLALLLGLGQLVEIGLVVVLREGQPIHHIA